MIDYEVKIFNSVHEVVAPLCATNRFVSTPIDEEGKIPASGLWEMDNFTVRRLQSSTPTENFSRITYQAEVAAKTKSQCRKIYAALDARMLQLNFTRMSGNYITYPDNPDFVKYVARYEAEIDSDGRIYRRP